MSGAAIAAKVTQALAKASAATGAGVLTATIVRNGQTTGPDHAPLVGQPTTHTFNAVMSSFTQRERANNQDIELDDVKILLNAATLVPEVDDVVTVSGVAYTVKGVATVRPGALDILHTLWARA